MKALTLIAAVLVSCFTSQGDATAQSTQWSEKVAATSMKLWPDSNLPGAPVKWNYDQGVVLKGIEGVWLATGEGKYFSYIQKSMDRFVNDDGTIRTYSPE